MPNPKPIGEFVLIKQDTVEETTSAGLINTNAKNIVLTSGTVVDCGAGVAEHLRHESGTRVRWTPTGRAYSLPKEDGDNLIVVHQEAIYLTL